jgi:hypothetical protein
MGNFWPQTQQGRPRRGGPTSTRLHMMKARTMPKSRRGVCVESIYCKFPSDCKFLALADANYQ